MAGACHGGGLQVNGGVEGKMIQRVDSETTIQLICNEIEILSQLDHP